MKCPLKTYYYGNMCGKTIIGMDDCDPDCAWLMERESIGARYEKRVVRFCAMARPRTDEKPVNFKEVK